MQTESHNETSIAVSWINKLDYIDEVGFYYFSLRSKKKKVFLVRTKYKTNWSLEMWEQSTVWN